MSPLAESRYDDRFSRDITANGFEIHDARYAPSTMRSFLVLAYCAMTVARARNSG